MTAHFRYDQFVEDALRSVVKRTLDRVAETGLPGNHHLYITFNPHQAGVEISPFLASQYPEEMTIVLQHQFWGLDVAEDHFEVTLSFNKVQERLVIPYMAITAFADPSVNFGLQFKATEGPAAAPALAAVPDEPDEKPAAKPEPEAAEQAADAEEPAEPAGPDDNVVTLDAFRKK